MISEGSGVCTSNKSKKKKFKCQHLGTKIILNRYMVAICRSLTSLFYEKKVLQMLFLFLFLFLFLP